MRNVFLQKSCRKWDNETSSRPLLVFVLKKTFYEIKASGKQLSFSMFYSPLFAHSKTKNKLSYKLQTADPEVKMSLRLVSPPHLSMILQKEFSHVIFY